MIGQRIASYELIAKVGSGGMGDVYRARDRKLDRDIALKILPDSFASDPDRLARFTREAKTLASLNHPNIAQVYDSGQDGASAFIAMRVGSIRRFLGRQGPDQPRLEAFQSLISWHYVAVNSARTTGQGPRNTPRRCDPDPGGPAMKYLLAGLALVVAVVAMVGATARHTPELELRLVSTKETQFPGEQADLRAMLVNNGSTAIYFDQYLMESRMQIYVEGEWTDCRPVLSILKGVADKLNWQRVDPGEDAAIEVGGYKCLGNDSVGGRDWSEIPGSYKLKVTASHRVLDSHEVGRLGPAPDGARAWTLTSKSLSVFVAEPIGIDAEALKWAREQGHHPVSIEVESKFPTSYYGALMRWQRMRVLGSEPDRIADLAQKDSYPVRGSVPDLSSPDGRRTVAQGQDMARWRIEHGGRLLREHPAFPHEREVRLSMAVSYAVLGQKDQAMQLLRALQKETGTPESQWASRFVTSQGWQ